VLKKIEMAIHRHIMHIDLDTFFVSVERLKDSKLNGLPVIVGGTGDRGVVASCSYEARKFGVRSAMSARAARKLCPQAVFIRGDHEAYNKYSRMVTAILSEAAPVIEKASIDEHYLDLTGLDTYFGCWKWATALRKKVIDETGLPISFGLSANKMVSKVATGLAKPNGQILVEHGTEKAFLAPLPVGKIPMIGEKTAMRLNKMGLTEIGKVQQLDPDVLKKAFGDSGYTIWKKCNGIDNSPVRNHHERKTISKETTFNKDTADVDQLKRILYGITDEIAFDLRKNNFLTGCVTVKIRYSDFRTEQLQQKIANTASTVRLYEKAMALFHQVYQRKSPLRLVGIRFSDLVHGTEQIDLFNDVAKHTDVNAALDSIRVRFGSRSITRAACL
jgi:DNA polymerase IV